MAHGRVYRIEEEVPVVETVVLRSEPFQDVTDTPYVISVPSTPQTNKCQESYAFQSICG